MRRTDRSGLLRARGSRLAVSFTALVGVVALALVAFAAPASAVATAVPLGTADSYAVLAGTAVVNTGPTVVTGDLGVSPGSSVTGFPPGIVTGTIHDADAAASQAQTDLTTAYNNAVGQAPDAPISGDLGGLTLTPGVYHSTGPIGLTGTLTLDGQGDPNAVFVIQVASALVTASASNVLLINGTQACNVFWQVGSAATLGTSSTIAGSILALTSVTVTTGTTVQGRILARNGAVTLDDNTITASTCAPPPPVAPTVTAAAPLHAPAAGGTVVTLTGTGFVAGQTTVTIGGDTIPTTAVTVVNATTLTFTAPAHAAGAVSITITTPSGTSGPIAFTFAAAAAPLPRLPSNCRPPAHQLRRY
jgi:hypothetical protein